MKRTLANKIENLIEVTHHHDPPIDNTDLPLLSLYSVYHRSNSFTSSIRTLIRTRRPHAKEVVQTTRLEQVLHISTLVHGRKGLPVTAKVALLDSTFKSYSNALVVALLTTLSNDNVILTIKPDYNVSLFDPTLPWRLQVQVQIIGAEQNPQAIMATLDHQIIYCMPSESLS
ncbi:hypothetical protein K1719_028040 [Acacia pycnantha]|nr:hypothetical protein K1719_028040 [Acacia pycnantha]